MKKIIICFIFSIFIVFQINSEVFRFKYNKGDAYRILSTVNEDVYLNGILSHNAQIVNRISTEVQDVTENNSGIHSSRFMTTELTNKSGQNKTLNWEGEYFSVFTRDIYGKYTISEEYFMPVVRNVPIFPEEDIKIGDKWTAEGHEAHDLRLSFGIKNPFKVPFTANYTYEGTIQKEDGTKLHVIKARYNLQFESPQQIEQNIENKSFEQLDTPQFTLGYSDQTIYWDNEKGMIDSYSEHFRIVIETRFGNVLEFRGTAGSEITNRKKLTKNTLDEVQQQIQELQIENTQVKSDDTGITISLENIQFLPDSSILMDSEKTKLQKIAKILNKFPENDLLISGHTALAGTFEARKVLSEERASSVANYLIELGVKDMYHIFTQGFGGEKPIASNDNPEGMARNRRVEITIMK